MAYPESRCSVSTKASHTTKSALGSVHPAACGPGAGRLAASGTSRRPAITVPARPMPAGCRSLMCRRLAQAPAAGRDAAVSKPDRQAPEAGGLQALGVDARWPPTSGCLSTRRSTQSRQLRPKLGVRRQSSSSSTGWTRSLRGRNNLPAGADRSAHNLRHEALAPRGIIAPDSTGRSHLQAIELNAHARN